MIARHTIDTIFETARVEEVIGEFVQLKKSGSNFKGLSPFTDERTPSFMVSPVKQIWKDFSSGKGGNVVTFLMEHEHFSYPEALRFLAKKYGIEIEETQQSDTEKEEASQRESLFILSEFAAKYFHQNLSETEAGKAIGSTYFKERGFVTTTIQKFSLGYALEQKDAFTAHALKSGFTLESLEQTGLSFVKDNAPPIDRFRGRVIFPIHSMSGRVLGFGGRILTQNKKVAKYINSPESPIYSKSKVLYGLFQSKQHIAKQDCCFLVEGYTDVLQFHQLGIQNVVASSGTALTPEQIRLIHRLTTNITVLFDGDAAGLRAALRGIDLILEQGLNVKVCTFPEGEDPDSFARANSIEVAQEYINAHSQDFIQFKAKLLAEESKQDPIKKAETVRDIVQSISRIPDAIKQELYIKSCAQLMDVSERVLFSTLAQFAQKQVRTQGKQQPTKENLQVVAPPEAEKVNLQHELEQKIVGILLLYGAHEVAFEEVVWQTNDTGTVETQSEWHTQKVFEKIYLDLQEDEIAFSNPNFKSLYEQIMQVYQTQGSLSVQNFMSALNPEHAKLVTHILMEDEKYTLHNWERKDIYVRAKQESLSQLVSDTILNLRGTLVSQKIDALSETLKEHSTEASKEDTLRTVADYMSLKKVLSEKLNRVL